VAKLDGGAALKSGVLPAKSQRRVAISRLKQRLKSTSSPKFKSKLKLDHQDFPAISTPVEIPGARKVFQWSSLEVF